MRTLLVAALTVSSIVTMAFALMPVNSLRAEETKIPDRCMYAYAEAGYQVATMVAAQISKLEAKAETQAAATALSVSRDLQCPVDPVTMTVDCTVAFVVSAGGKVVSFVDLIDCVEKAAGRPFPSPQ